LRFHLQPHPLEVFFSAGRFLFATTRDVLRYCGDSSIILPQTNLGTILEAWARQRETGCPVFLHIAQRGGFPHQDVAQIVREHGQRAFASVWTAGRTSFAFELLHEFPDYAKTFSATFDDPDNWSLGSLRHVRFDDLPTAQRPDPNGCPAYTRKGYELIQRLKLNDVEAGFATAINGTDTIAAIAGKIGVALNDTLLVAFRFSMLEIIDCWSWNILSLPGGAK
jgi:hypothetical protein